MDIFKSDNVLQGIDEYIEAHQPGLLMLAVKRKSLIERLLDGSVSRRIALHTRVPLLGVSPLNHLEVFLNIEL
ncbi:MAG: universal stress protein [Chitinophagales bacterium]|nr:universal stress protein [Chitinophagales bacterium]